VRGEVGTLREKRIREKEKKKNTAETEICIIALFVYVDAGPFQFYISARISREFNRRDIICISLEFRVLSRLRPIHLRACARARASAVAKRTEGSHEGSRPRKKVTRLANASSTFITSRKRREADNSRTGRQNRRLPWNERSQMSRKCAEARQAAVSAIFRAQ